MEKKFQKGGIYTELVEFQNRSRDALRGLFVHPNESVIQKAILFLHGFERTSVAEPKFKRLADLCAREYGIPSFRFDYSGCGISDGDFSSITIARMVEEANAMAEYAREKIQPWEMVVVAHSVSGGVAAEMVKNNPGAFKKIVLLSPALNQKELLRFWFVISAMKKQKRDLEITWENYETYLDEEAFLKDCEREDKMTKANFISSQYFLENRERDYSSEFLPAREKVLHVHGDKDDKVPHESLNIVFPNKIIILGGDHDLERPDMMEQWLEKCALFIGL